MPFRIALAIQTFCLFSFFVFSSAKEVEFSKYSVDQLNEEAVVNGRAVKTVFLAMECDEEGESLEQLQRFAGHPNEILVGIADEGIFNIVKERVPDITCRSAVFGRKGQKPENFQVIMRATEFTLHNAVKSQIGYFNSHFNPISAYWEHRTTGEATHPAVRSLEPKALTWISSFVGDVFHVKDDVSGEVLMSHVVVGEGVVEVKPVHPEAGGVCEFDWDEHRYECEEPPQRDWEKIYRDRNSTDEERLRWNREKPSSTPHFTEVGYTKTRVPDDAWEWIMEYYHANRDTQTKVLASHSSRRWIQDQGLREEVEEFGVREWAQEEVWSDANTYTNHIEAPSYMIHLPEGGDTKTKIFDKLMPFLSEWSGVEDLEATAMYGIRIYTNGAELRGHCDRTDTHAVSAIINVDQDVEEDWNLEIYNHAGVATNITMSPGDLVLYESASCQHGRPYAMKGNHYTNMFVHTRPRDPALWLDLLRRGRR